MSDTEEPAADAWFDLELRPPERVRVGSRRMVVIGIVVVLALVGGVALTVGRGGSSEAQERISRFEAAMVEPLSFTYELDLIAENVTSLAEVDMVPGGPVEMVQIDGRVAAEDRFALEATSSTGVLEVVRVGPDLFHRETGPEGDRQWWRSDHEAPELPSTEELSESLEPEGDEDASEARLRAISGVYLSRMIVDPVQLPVELAKIDPQVRPEELDADDASGHEAGDATTDDAADDSTGDETAADDAPEPITDPSGDETAVGDAPVPTTDPSTDETAAGDATDEGAEASDDDVSVVGWVPFPIRYRSVLTGVDPMVVHVRLGEDGHPRSARFEIRHDDKAVVAEVRFADWGADLEIVAPDGAKEAKVFEAVGEAIEAEPDEPIGDEPLDAGEGSLEDPRALDPDLLVWLPTSVPDDFRLADLVSADRSGDDRCRGVFAVWMASDRPAAPWVSQDTPEEGNSQLLTVRSVPADCSFVERMPLFQPGPFGDRPARRMGDRWEVLLDDTWVVSFDSVVVTWDELVAMVASLDTVPVGSLEARLP